MRYLVLLVTLLFWVAPPLQAQTNDSEFRDYADYAAFVDRHIMTRKFTPLIQRLGGRDEYTPEELAGNQRQMEGVWPRNFENVTVFNEQDLGGGIRQEARAYWTGTSYAFFYAMYHQRDDKFVVIVFLLNSSSKPIMQRF